MAKRRQLNIRTTEADEDLIEAIRKVMSPIPTTTEVIQIAIREAAQKRGVAVEKNKIKRTA